MFFSRKHDLLDLEYGEFKDLLYLPITWFSKVYEKNKNLKYPGKDGRKKKNNLQNISTSN